MMTPTEVSANPEARSAPLLRLADLIDRRPGLVLPVWIFAYFAVLWRAAHRPLWYDELFTYYTSTAPTFARFFGSVLFDVNPPLSFLFVRASITLFGDSPFAIRLPSMLAFLAASLLVYVLVKRRLGGGLGLAALGILWSFSLTAYAAEARPYGLLLGLFSIAMLCWLHAIEAARWTKWHTGLAAAIGAMLLTHCFSPVFVAAIGAGELARTIAAKRIDKRVWAAWLAPLPLLLLYIPLVRNAQAPLHPHAFDASLSTIPLFYMRIFAPVLPAIGVILMLSLIRSGREAAVRMRDLARSHEIAFCLAAFVLPTVIVGYCIWSGIPFFDRYGIGATISGSLMLTVLLATLTRRNVDASVTAAVLILILFCLMKPGIHAVMERNENVSRSYLTVDPELPFVAACGLTFLEMDHRESPEFVKRLYYLMDRESSVTYVHSTNFENYPIVQRWFPTRANVGAYHQFVKQHRKFLVLTAHDCPTDWLLFKLKDDGAQIRFLQDLKTGYYDRELYEVTLPGE